MKYFGIVKTALDRHLPGTFAKLGVAPQQGYASMLAHLEAMGSEWRTGCKPRIDYPNPLCRLAYVHSHVPANAGLFEKVLRTDASIQPLITNRVGSQGRLSVCAFGGGPGTELLGLCKHLWSLRSRGQHTRLHFTVLDQVPEWAESWSMLIGEIEHFLATNCGRLPDWPFSVSRSFIPFDMTDLAQYGSVPTLFGQDLFVLNYVVSELLESVELARLQAVVQTMVDSAPPDSVFLIVDRDQSDIISASQQLISGSGLVASAVHSDQDNMDLDEQTSLLEPYPTLIGRQPRVTWKAFWMTGKKP